MDLSARHIIAAIVLAWLLMRVDGEAHHDALRGPVVAEVGR